ncbi:DUF1616 domain-containing protein [Candidatus Bathyarchaeota archaeon]|nr:DUF1616 domain-containing protein [Candidatus Bathyarchaeota archaeon]
MIFQHKFMEKKIKKTSEVDNSPSYRGEEKTIIITIIIALVIIGALLVNVVITSVPEEKFSVIYYLDSEKQLENIPKTVVLDQNNTFSLWVGVENHNGTTLNYFVEVKIDNGTAPIGNSSVISNQSFEKTLEHNDSAGPWEFPVTITIDQLGNNRILFELWIEMDDEIKWTGNWVSLSIEAI